MRAEYDPKRFVVRERFKFWSDMSRKPGETLQELATRIRQDAATCDFASIKNPQDEALRQRFICSVNNEAVLKALFRIKDDELSFAKAIQTAIETEDAAKVAKETMYGPASGHFKKPQLNKLDTKKKIFKKIVCYRCGKNHLAPDCPHKESKCNFCHIKGHLESVCRKKKVKTIKTSVKAIKSCSYTLKFESETSKPVRLTAMVDTGSAISGLTETFFKEHFPSSVLNSEPQTLHNFDGTPLKAPALGTFKAPLLKAGRKINAVFYVLPDNYGPVIGQNVISLLRLKINGEDMSVNSINPKQSDLARECDKLCDTYSNIFRDELGCLKDFELEVKFKENSSPIFQKPRNVPFAIKSDLSQGYQTGIQKGIFTKVSFNEYGTPVVPIRKSTGKIRICGDYKATINKQLEPNRYPIPLPSDLMQKLGGGQYYSKIDLADAYNQIKLKSDSAKKLALSTHQGVLLQNRLPFGITSAPGYFQQIMDNLTCDLPGTAAYLDDILVSGKTADDHMQNLENLFQRLSDKNLRCKKEKCVFAQSSVEYLGFSISKDGIHKTDKIDAIINMPAPTSVTQLKSFLGQVQFYNKFLSDASTTLEPLYNLTRKNTPWFWGKKEQEVFSV